MPKKRYIIDNDGTNLFLRTPLLENDLIWTVQQCPKSVTTYMVCPNCIGKFMYPCSVGELVPREVAPYLVDAIKNGNDLFGKFLNYLRLNGKEIFITYRMNDVHNADDPNHWGASDFKKQHPDFLVDPEAVRNGKSDWMSYCLDYSQNEVQNYILSSLADLADKYDVDGFQLDWMRFPRHLSGNPAWEKRSALTHFMSRVRNMLDEVGRSRGRRILLSVRIPTWLEGCKLVGIDIAEWTKEKLLDFITLAPFLSSDFYMPIRDFRSLISNEDIPIYAGTDLNHSGRCHTIESYRAWALSMYDQGFDGINLFNFPCWKEYIAEQPYEWIADLDELNKIRNKPALYTIISNKNRLHAIDQSTQLPKNVEKESRTEFKLYIPSLALPASRALMLIAVNGDYKLLINGNDLKDHRKAPSGNIFLMFIDQNTLNDEPRPEYCSIFTVEPSLLVPGDNTLSIINTGDSSITIQRIDIGLWY
ncbi:MAG: hypothetical protein ACUVWN_14530 [bacterium]